MGKMREITNPWKKKIHQPLSNQDCGTYQLLNSPLNLFDIINLSIFLISILEIAFRFTYLFAGLKVLKSSSQKSLQQSFSTKCLNCTEIYYFKLVKLVFMIAPGSYSVDSIKRTVLLKILLLKKLLKISIKNTVY